jgi:hypothetical protein
VTSQEPENPHPAEPDVLDTEVISVAAPAPVFVDSTGRRSRLFRRIAYAFGALVMLYGGLISVSLAGGPVRSSAVLPLPGLEPQEDDDRPPARPNPTPAPTPSHALTAQVVTGALPGRPAARSTAPRLESTRVPSKAKPSTRPAATKQPTTRPAPTATTSRPAESTTTPPADTTVTTPPVTTPATLPPAPPGTGGQGGGTAPSPEASA